MSSQDHVIEFLSSADAYGGMEGVTCSVVERRETHISIVFLAGQSAYKMKTGGRLSLPRFFHP